MENRKEFYILAKSGEMMFYLTESKESQEESSSKLLTASYLTGVLQFAKAVSNEIISNFEMGKLDIWLKNGNKFPLYFVLIVGKKVKLRKKKIEKRLSNIIEEFESRYTDNEITNWDGNLNAFDDFSPIAKKVLGF